MDNLKVTNTLLLVIVIPLVFYLAKVLGFILIPLVFSMFITLLFLPLMRWFKKKGIKESIGIIAIVGIMALIVTIGVQVIKISSHELRNVDDEFIQAANDKILHLIALVDATVGLQLTNDEAITKQLFEKFNVIKNLGPTLGFINRTVTMLLMTLFFTILWLSGSINMERVLNKTLIKKKFSSVKTFIKIERDLVKFIKVKVIVSLLTGIGTGLVCYFFGVSFPIFWGLFAFLINFVQMVGSFIAVITVGLFGFIELDLGSVLFFYFLCLTSVQVLFGTIIEPVFMGKSFSINIITVLVMLMLWGYIWGIPGMILSIPLTVFFKIIFEQFPNTQFVAELISGDAKQINIKAIQPLINKKNSEEEEGN